MKLNYGFGLLIFRCNGSFRHFSPTPAHFWIWWANQFHGSFI